MTKLETAVDIPLIRWEDGSIRITGSRVTIDSIIHYFRLGYTAEEIAKKFPSVLLTQVYGAIYYYLTHQQEVDDYLKHRNAEAEEVREMIESSPLHTDKRHLRERLMDRVAERGSLKSPVKQE